MARVVEEIAVAVEGASAHLADNWDAQVARCVYCPTRPRVRSLCPIEAWSKNLRLALFAG